MRLGGSQGQTEGCEGKKNISNLTGVETQVLQHNRSEETEGTIHIFITLSKQNMRGSCRITTNES
jgi:hypothetical protein